MGCPDLPHRLRRATRLAAVVTRWLLASAIRVCRSRIAVQRLYGASVFCCCGRPHSACTGPISASPATVAIAPASLPRCPSARIPPAISTPSRHISCAGSVISSAWADDGAFVTAAERFDTNSGASFRQFLTYGFGGTTLHVPARGARPSGNPASTGAVAPVSIPAVRAPATRGAPPGALKISAASPAVGALPSPALKPPTAGGPPSAPRIPLDQGRLPQVASQQRAFDQLDVDSARMFRADANF